MVSTLENQHKSRVLVKANHRALPQHSAGGAGTDDGEISIPTVLPCGCQL